MSNDDANGFPSLPGRADDDTESASAPGTPTPPSSTPPSSAPPASAPPGAAELQPPAFPQPPAPPAPAPDYGQPPQPSAPNYGQPPTPPDYGQPPAPAPGYAPAPPGYAAPNGGMVKGPRPDVKVGGILVAAGALLTIIGVFLPWATGAGASVNGMDDFFFRDGGDFYLAESPGTLPIVFAVIMLGFGITLIFAGRVLAVAILAIVGAVIAALIGLAMIGIASGQADDISSASVGIGAILQPIAPLLSLAGAIVATSKRRRMVPAGPAGGQPQFG